MEITLIAAMSPQRVIGHDNTIPWHIPDEQFFFKYITMGRTLIMGRKTWQSIDSPLPGRDKIVLSRSLSSPLSPSCLVAPSLAQAIKICADQSQVFIIGGASLYQESIPHAHSIYLSIIHKEFPGDTFFPEIPPDQFSITAQITACAPTPYTTFIYRRNGAAPPLPFS